MPAMSNDQYPLSNIETPVNVKNPLSVMQPGERVICEVRRHPIGLVSVYFVTGLVLIVALTAAILTPFYASFLTSQQKLGVEAAAALVIILDILFTYIGVWVYQGNRWVVTSDSITQVEQVSLFDRHASQLSLANLEDVSAQQNGILQTMLGYGDLIVESAGERSKFVFNFCPDPNEYARKIIAAHEEYIARRPEDMVAANRPLSTVTSYNQPPQNSGA